MRKLTAKKIVEFRRLAETRKQTFVNNLQKPASKTESGGDYWISCISAITSACKNNDTSIVNTKIDYLLDQHKSHPYKRTKDMYQRNIDILEKFKSYDFTKLKPKKVTDFLTHSNTKSLLTIKGLAIQVFPSHVFTFKNNEKSEVGAIWFVAQLGGFKIEELQIFCELLHKYLQVNYSKNYIANPDFCIVFDVVTQKVFKYSKIPSEGDYLLTEVLSDLRKYIK